MARNPISDLRTYLAAALVGCLLIFAGTSSLLAAVWQTESSSADRVEHWIDLRLASDREMPSYVVFAARGTGAEKSYTGHAFLVLYGEDSERKASIGTAIGFYPKEGEGKGVATPVAGELADEIYDRRSVHYATHLLRVRVTQSQFQAVLSFLRQREIDVENGVYKFYLRHTDCLTLLVEMAEHINSIHRDHEASKLVVVGRTQTTTPRRWLQRFIEANKDTGLSEEVTGDTLFPSP